MVRLATLPCAGTCCCCGIGIGAFAGVCKDARALSHFANGVCSNNEAELQARVNDIQNSCCVQNGVNVCTEGVPWTCDAQCAVPFMT